MDHEVWVRWAETIAAATPPSNGLPNDRNAIFTFASWTLTIVAVVTLIWPLNIPLAGLAYKLRNGYQPIDMEPSDFWWRSTFASLGLALATLVMLLLAWLIVQKGGFPAGVVHMVLLLFYLPAGVWYLFWMFALEDMVQSLSVFLLYVLVGGLPILLIGRLAGLWVKLAHVAPWLLYPS